MAEEEHGFHEDPRPSEYRKVSAFEREREWLAKQFSKEREAYWEKDTVSLMEPDSLTSVERAFFTYEQVPKRGSVSVAERLRANRGLVDSRWSQARSQARADAQAIIDDHDDLRLSQGRPVEGRRYDVVRIGLRHEIVSISWSSREALLDQFRNLDSMNEIRDAFRAVGTSRPVRLTGPQKAELLNTITAWAGQTDGG